MKLTTCNICGCVKKCITCREDEEMHELAVCPECLGISEEKALAFDEMEKGKYGEIQ